MRIEAEAIWAAAGFAKASIARDERGAYLVARDAPIDGGGIAEYESAAGPGGQRSRSEAALVFSYGEFLADRGHHVSGRQYVAESESRPLRADLMVKDLNVLVEAKATDARYAIRMAIGQLYDYRRFEPTTLGRSCATAPRRLVPDAGRSQAHVACRWDFLRGADRGPVAAP